MELLTFSPIIASRPTRRHRHLATHVWARARRFAPWPSRWVSRPAPHALLATLLALGIAACGGGGGGRSDSVGVASGTAASGSSATVVITVTDAFGAPVQGAFATLESARGAYSQAYTDSRGRAAFVNVPSGTADLYAAASNTSTDDAPFAGYANGVTVPPTGRVELEITLRPAAPWTSIVVAPATVEPAGLAPDGRSLEFSLRLIYLPMGLHGDYGGEELDTIAIRACTPDQNNDQPTYQADCVSGPAGFDAPYDVVEGGKPLAVTKVPGGASVPFTAALLLDQSHTITANDTFDSRLPAVKYFLISKGATAAVGLAAFAADDNSAGNLSPLPRKPVTILPQADSRFTTSGSDLFSTVDSLASSEGGVAPLYTSIDNMLDFTATNASIEGPRAVVVLTTGPDDTCGSAAQCQAAREALVEKSRATGVAIVSISLTGESEQANGHALSEMAEASGGVTLWANYAKQLGALFGALPSLLDGSAEVRETTFRIESSIDGTFQSGRTVFGTLLFETCPYGCIDTEIPFAVRIP
jgi:hypothetical protein